MREKCDKWSFGIKIPVHVFCRKGSNYSILAFSLIRSRNQLSLVLTYMQSCLEWNFKNFKLLKVRIGQAVWEIHVFEIAKIFIFGQKRVSFKLLDQFLHLIAENFWNFITSETVCVPISERVNFLVQSTEMLNPTLSAKYVNTNFGTKAAFMALSS